MLLLALPSEYQKDCMDNELCVAESRLDDYCSYWVKDESLM